MTKKFERCGLIILEISSELLVWLGQNRCEHLKPVVKYKTKYQHETLTILNCKCRNKWIVGKKKESWPLLDFLGKGEHPTNTVAYNFMLFCCTLYMTQEPVNVEGYCICVCLCSASVTYTCV